MTAEHSEDQARVTVWVRGRVQGVGFRWWVRSRARELGLAGSATNLDDGRVEVVAQGSRTSCERLVRLLGGPPVDGRPGSVTGIVEQWAEPRGGIAGFVER